MSIAATARGVKAAALYALIGGTWILVTDRILFEALGQDGRVAAWQTWKGWVFVAASALFVFVLARRAHLRERALRAREAELLVITDSMPGPVSRVDRHGRYLFANLAYSDWFGLAPSEVVGRTHQEVLGEELYGRIEGKVRRALAGERVTYLEPTHSPDGQTRWGLVTLVPDRDPDGAVQGHFTIVQDVTAAEEQRRAHAESEVRYRRLVEKAPDGILIYKDGRVQLANPAAQRLVRAVSESDVTGRPWDMFVDEVDRDRAVERVELLLRGEGDLSPMGLRLRRLDGTRVPVEVSGVRFMDGDQPALHLIMRDISARKSAEAALRDLNRSLENRIERRTEELELARERAESADRLKSLFLASMSHELRTPLDSINRLTGELLGEQPGELADEQRKRLGVVRRAARHLRALVDDVLDISSIEAGELVLEQADYDLGAIVREAAEPAASRARAKGLEFEVHIGAGLHQARGDSGRLRQILGNLLSNAVKFTDAGRVTVAATPVRGAGARIEISDTGVGILPADHERVFHPFCQVRPADERDPGGTGLGLAISKRLARLMGGDLALASTPGTGSTFVLELPLEVPAMPSDGGHVRA